MLADLRNALLERRRLLSDDQNLLVMKISESTVGMDLSLDVVLDLGLGLLHVLLVNEEDRRRNATR